MADWERLNAVNGTDMIAPNYKDNASDSACCPDAPSNQIHACAQNFWNPYISASQTTNAARKDVIMPETNTASCVLFASALNSYAAGLYFIDLALHNASISMSQILHTGGVCQSYSPFTLLPKQHVTFRQWTTTPQYYSV
ncbi:hypothetical protein FS837_000721 [Tulasnella sp. UAMH 9824]|nr:hypothetical protein FS837_000721 [Tulasnella sp. UAMH 9824]